LIGWGIESMSFVMTLAPYVVAYACLSIGVSLWLGRAIATMSPDEDQALTIETAEPVIERRPKRRPALTGALST